MQDVEADIRVRGNYTASYSKKPFQIRFASKQNLFGLNSGNKFKKWILLAEYNDSSMLRNALSFYMGQQLNKNSGIWVPTFTYAHFYIQDSETLYYMGLYLLCDQKEQSKKRVNVFEPEDGYTGTDIGYFFERDDYFQTETDPTFFIEEDAYYPVAPVKSSSQPDSWSRQVNGVRIPGDGFSIKSKVTDDSQVTFLRDRVLKVYSVMYNAVYNNILFEIDENGDIVRSEETDPIAALNKTINVESFVNAYILHEIVCNPDLGHSSFYFSLDMSDQGDKRLTLCCPWDFDLAIGLHRTFAYDPSTIGLWARQCKLNPWISMLPDAAWFMQLVEAKWQEIYDNYFFSKTLKLIDDYCTTYYQEYITNFTEWNIT